MTRAALAAMAILAIPVAYAQAHEATEVTIRGPSNHPTVTQNAEQNFQLGEVNIDCPFTPENLRCKIVATVTTAARVRVKRGKPKRLLRLGRVAYTLDHGRDRQRLHLIHLTDAGDKLLVKSGGRLRARAVVEAAQVGHWGYRKSRTFKFVLKDHE